MTNQPNRIERGRFHPFTKGEVTKGTIKQQVLDDPRRCPTCGGMCLLWPCLACHPELGVMEVKKPGRKPAGVSK
jgi:hypothetical protein